MYNSLMRSDRHLVLFFFFFQAEDGIRDLTVTGVQTCALPISCVPLLRDSPRDARKHKRSSPARRSARRPWRALVSNRQAKHSTSRLRIFRSVELRTARGRLTPRNAAEGLAAPADAH